MNFQLGNVGHIIQLAIAPVFLLAGVGTLLGVLTNRLARIIDRSRVLEEKIRTADGELPEIHTELEVLFRRTHLINSAITLGTSCGLLVCVVIAMLFIGGALELQLDNAVALMFVLAMFSLIGSFGFLLREIFVATKSMSIRGLPSPRK